MPIIDSTYFQSGQLAIPQAVSNANITGNVATSVQKITAYVEKYEDQLMVNAIGYTNYQTLLSVIDNLEDQGNEIWNDLVNGKEYTYESKTVKWAGLRETFGTIKQSLIANYVYYHYLKDDSIVYATTGTVKNKADNAESISPSLKLTQAWREFIEKYQYGVENNAAVFVDSSGRTGYDLYSPQNNVNRSLYQFLRDNDSYGEYTFTVYDNLNSFGI